MAIPQVNITVKNGGLGIASANSEGIQAKVGHIAEAEFRDGLGKAIGQEHRIPVNVPRTYNDAQKIIAECGSGDLAQAALLALQQGGPVVVCRVAEAVVGQVEQSGEGPKVSASGTPLDGCAHTIVAIVTQGGALGTAKVSISVDGEEDRAAAALPEGEAVLPVGKTGIALTFPAGQYVAGTTYTVRIDADRQKTYKAALDALATSGLSYELAHCVGFVPSDEMAGFVSMLAAQSAALWSAKQYDSALFACEVDASDADAAQSALQNAKSDHVCACLGRVTAANPISGASRDDMPLGWPAMARASAVGIGIDLARVADGPLTGVTAVVPDEQVMGGTYDAAGFTTGRTFPRKSGIYLTNGRMLSAEGSDIRYVQHRRIMNAACAAAYDNLASLLGREVPVDAETGGIEEGAAASIEANCLRAVLDRVGQAVTSASVAVDRTVNLLSTEELLVSISLIPFGYLKRIEATIGFKNPALASA